MSSNPTRVRKGKNRPTKSGAPKTFVIEVGPITVTESTDAKIAARERHILRDMDALIRNYLAVGRRSKAVRSRIADDAETS